LSTNTPLPANTFVLAQILKFLQDLTQDTDELRVRDCSCLGEWC